MDSIEVTIPVIVKLFPSIVAFCKTPFVEYIGVHSLPDKFIFFVNLIIVFLNSFPLFMSLANVLNVSLDPT